MHFIEIIICHVFPGYYMSCIPWFSPVFTCIRQKIKWSLSHALLYSFKVLKYVIILIYGKKIHFMENQPIFLGIWGEAELFLGIWGAKANNFREKRTLFSGSWGYQCIIFRDLGSTYPPPPWGPPWWMSMLFHIRNLLAVGLMLHSYLKALANIVNRWTPLPHWRGSQIQVYTVFKIIT